MIKEILLDSSCSFFEVPFQGETIKFRQWGNASTAKSMILLVHGLGAHGAWFEAAAKELTSRGFLVLAYDQRGFGERHNIVLSTYKEWIGDLTGLLKQLSARFNKLPFYLLGNSMGALVVMAASAGIKVEGIVICSPGFDGHPEAFSLGYKIKTILSALIRPSHLVRLPYNLDLVTRVASVKKWLMVDPLQRLDVPGSMLFELLKLSKAVLASLKNVAVPVLMITAGQEKVVDNKINMQVYERLVAPSKKHIEMSEGWHDLMFDPLVDEVADAILQWQTEVSNSKFATKEASASAH